jgi:hypothetical protein
MSPCKAARHPWQHGAHCCTAVRHALKGRCGRPCVLQRCSKASRRCRPLRTGLWMYQANVASVHQACESLVLPACCLAGQCHGMGLSLLGATLAAVALPPLVAVTASRYNYTGERVQILSTCNVCFRRCVQLAWWVASRKTGRWWAQGADAGMEVWMHRLR